MRLVVDVARTKGLEKSTLNGRIEGRSKSIQLNSMIRTFRRL